MPRAIELDGDLGRLLAEYRAARDRRQRATDAAWTAAHGDEQAAALSLAMCLDNRTKEGN